MLTVNKITSHSVVDFAAEELKKYLRMMMPECGDVKISYNPEARDGFRLGLMQDLGLDVSDAEDVELDDIVYIDCTEKGGVIAGDNPRAVLIAVYEYLRRNGCRWLFPGVDGEYIPMRDITSVNYRHKASCRYRGPCIEGATSQQILLETIDFLPKAGMNVFMMQFFVPTPFYKHYYNHTDNPTRPPEPLNDATMLQWKIACECEMSKRGVQFHDVGHGWTAAPFGINCSSGWEVVDDSVVPEESQKYLAEISGERKLYKGKVLNTQFCMSNPEAREKVARHIADYAKKHSNVDYIHVWLGDASKNHCECAACREKTVSDWYVILLNEINRELTERALNTRIVFIVYTDTTWAPVLERIENPARFTLMLAPITRSYTRSLTDKVPELKPFVRNKMTLPADLDEYMGYYEDWRKVYSGAALAFEYHFWKHQTFDFSGQQLALRIFEDVEAYKSHGVDGMIACGSQRSYFPNGYAYYVFARKQFDISLTLDELAEDYYSHAYGEDWRSFYDYLSELERAVPFKFLQRELSEDEAVSPLYSPRVAETIAAVPSIIEKGRALINDHYNMPRRVQTASVRILEEHARYVELFADSLYSKALGRDDEALKKLDRLVDFVRERELQIERYYELKVGLAYARFVVGVKGKPKVAITE